MSYSEDYKEQKTEYQQYLQRNIALLDDLVFCEQPSYPNLSKMLSKGQAKRRLYALILYFFQYGNTAPLTEAQLSILFMNNGEVSKEQEFKWISYHDIRGIEILFSFSAMANTLCKDKHWDNKGWERYVYLFMALGLLRRHRPDQHVNVSGDNTPLQETSLIIAGWKRKKDGTLEKLEGKKEIKRSVTWYHVPNYEKEKQLEQAEKRACLFLQNKVSVSNISKDNVRDVLGEKTANSIWDTVNREPYKPVQDMRNKIEAVLYQQLKEHGFTTEEKLLEEIYVRYDVAHYSDEDDDILSPMTEDEFKKLKEDSFTIAKIKKRWHEMKPYFSKRGIKAIPPRKEDRQRWNLPDRRWIIIDVNRWRGPAS